MLPLRLPRKVAQEELPRDAECLALMGMERLPGASIRIHRVAAATDGIASWWPGQPRGICLQWVGVRKAVARVSWIPGEFRALLVRIADRWGAQIENRLNNVGAGEMGAQSLPISKSRGEIPGQTPERP